MTKTQAREALHSVLADIGADVEIGGLRYNSRQKQFIFWLYRGDEEARLTLTEEVVETLTEGSARSEEGMSQIRAALRQFK